MSKTSGMRGFTLVELMVTLAVLAIIIAIAVPNMSTFIKKQAVRSTADELILSLVYARSEALKLNNDVYVRPEASGMNGWSAGWCVTQSSSSCSENDLLRKFSPSGKSISISNDALLSQSGNLKFDRRGLAKRGSIPLGKDATFTVEHTGQPEIGRRCVSLNKIGRTAMIDCPAQQ